jgi:hypothetical protein
MPVLNRQKRIVGILSLSDLALKAPEELFLQVSKTHFPRCRAARCYAHGSIALARL